MKKYIFICLLICLTWAPFAKAAKSRTDIVERRIDELELKLKHYKLSADLNTQIQEKISQTRKDQLETLEKVYKERHSQLTGELNKKLCWEAAAAILLVVLSAGGIFIIPKYITKKAKEEVDRRIGKTIEAKNKVIRRMISDSETETILRKESKLLALSKNAEGKNKMLDLLGSMEFHDYDSKLIDEVWDGEEFKEGFDYSGYLIVFNHISEREINKILNRTRETSMVSYYTLLPHQKIEQRERINFANSPFTLYARTIEVLKYNFLAGKNKK